MVIPNDGEQQLLADLLGGGSLNNWSLRLFKTNVTPAETDTYATYTLADFTGYSNKTLTRSISSGTWNTPDTSGTTLETQNARSIYGSAAQSWSATSVQTVYGYLIYDATATKLIAAEAFASAVGLVNPSTLSLQPVFELG